LAAERIGPQEDQYTPAPDVTVYRAMLYESWVRSDGQGVEHEAYLRRPKKDLNGISIRRRPEDCRINMTKPLHGVAALVVGRVRTLQRQDVNPPEQLDVRFDSATHGMITGLPFNIAATRKEAIRLAELLAEMSDLDPTYR
jgi:hypothetical protein